MTRPACIALGVGGIAACVTIALTGPASARQAQTTQVQELQQLHQQHPGVATTERAGRIRRVYGAATAFGASALQSAEAFRQQHAGVFGVAPQDLVPAAGGQTQPVMFDRATATYKFTLVRYEQQLQGVPVFRGQLKLLVRNAAGFPAVLASADLHDLGGFALAQRAAAAPAAPATIQVATDRIRQVSAGLGQPQVTASRKVIWAGIDEMQVAPRLADELEVRLGHDLWLFVVDSATGRLHHEEQLTCVVDISGTAEGRTTEGIGTDECEPEVSVPLPYTRVTAGANSAFTAADGSFLIPNPGTGSIDVVGTLDGQWFDVFDFFNNEISETDTVTPPGPATLVFNSANVNEQVRAQVNGYVHANRVRDFVLQYNPAYPTLNFGNFPVTVNRTDGFCPQNAWYDPGGGGSINFCVSSGSAPNTAWSSVVYHEYGHHLVNAAGSGQGAYGEGTGDVMSLLVLDSPFIGWGFFGDCFSSLRNADNGCQYDPGNCSSCGSASHSCGNLMSGAVWSVRDELVITEPGSYIDVLAGIAVNAILVHSGSSITPDIAVDYLTLDDDDADICNGTPHFAEIAAGFAEHGLFEEAIEFVFPSGLPSFVSPGGGTTVQVTVSCLSAPPTPGTGTLHVDTGGGFVAIPMDVVSGNDYEAVFPASACGTNVQYYFSAETGSGTLVTFPDGAPGASLSAISAIGVTPIIEDDFETDEGWSVSGSVIDGPWERDVPISNGVCDRGNPGTDGDGSGQCYLTDNSSANGCNSDVDEGSTILTSPVLDASGDPLISYLRWFSNTQGSSPGQDTFVVEASDNGGATWSTVEVVGPSSQNDGGWFQHTFQVSDVVSPTDQFRIRFIAQDTDPQSVVEAGVDGFTMFVAECGAPCPGDCGDMNGSVGTADLLALLAQWGGGPGGCDVDGDGTIGTADLLELLASWGACP